MKCLQRYNMLQKIFHPSMCTIAKVQKRSFCITQSWSERDKALKGSKAVDRAKLAGIKPAEMYLTSIGAKIEKIKKEIRLPLEDLNGRVRSNVDFLGELCGLDASDVGRMISRRPRILLLNEQQIEHCVWSLRKVGLKEQAIATMLKKAPGILTSKIEDNLEDKLEVLYNLEVHPSFSVKDVLKIVTKCPALVSTCTSASIEEKVHFLRNTIGFYQNQLHKIIIKQPSILTFSQENVKSKFDYCYRKMSVSMPEIAQCPRVWQCSLKRLKDRHNYLKHLNVIADRVDGSQLERIATLSDVSFSEKLALTSLSEFQAFIGKTADL
ncbi:transcription termination factor 3, mitochondrial-like [Dendronephthya gigantea]|uniref:transcription termination factor 3, mitochondrial-like n=1 Tax=Dendronephthya gigantea TaxID=151771 RepID=UPI0010697B93|nr:transcription termination factor 3, mitochondrial-like [Dendronephthya gigantea]